MMRDAMRDVYAVDRALAEQGVALTGFAGGVVVRARWMKSYIVRSVTQNLLRKHRQAILSNQGLLPPELQDAIDIEIAATAVVTGWEGVTDAGGNPLPWSVANARALFAELPEFMREIVGYASLTETYRAAVLEEAVLGNSAAPSAPGSASTESSSS